MIITGGDGFIGRNLVDKVGVDAKIIDKKRGSYVEVLPDLAGVTFEKEEPIVHLAAVSSIKECLGNLGSVIDSNYNGTQNMIDIARKHDSPLVFASSYAVYGTESGEYSLKTYRTHGSESHINVSFFDDINYANSKKWGEYMTNLARDTYGLKTLNLRFANVYGWKYSRNSSGVVQKFIRKILNFKPIQIEGDGTQTRDYIHVSDVCDIILESISRIDDLPSRDYWNLGTGKDTTINKLVKILDKYFNFKTEHVKMPGYREEIESPKNNFIWKELGLEAPRDLDEGIGKIAKGFWESLDE